MDALMLIIVAIVSYILGSLPSGLLLCRVCGHGDLRQQGSGNIGTTNVLRVTGSQCLTCTTLLCDMGKALAPALIAKIWLSPLAAAIAGLAAFLGHCYPVWLNFKGGKGVASGLGILLIWQPVAGLAAILAWLGIALSTAYSSLAAIIAFLLAPLYIAFLPDFAQGPVVTAATDPLFFGAVAVMSIIVLWRHRRNIVNLAQGQEDKISWFTRNKKSESHDSRRPV